MAAIHGSELWPNQFKTVFLIKLRNLSQDNYPNLGKDYSIEEVLAKEYRISARMVSQHRWKESCGNRWNDEKSIWRKSQAQPRDAPTRARIAFQLF
jgi:hypothetical protein